MIKDLRINVSEDEAEPACMAASWHLFLLCVKKEFLQQAVTIRPN